MNATRIPQQPEMMAEILIQKGLPTSRNNCQHLAVLWTALRIFMEREQSRGSLWAKYDEEDALSNMRTKFRRIEHYVESGGKYSSAAQPHAELVDDALDLINYTAFLLRHVLGWKPDVQDKPYEEHLDHPYSDR